MKNWSLPVGASLLVSLWLAVAGYILLFNRMGFYWDEWVFAWIAHTYGAEGLARNFATSRPYWGILYRLIMPLIGSDPWKWQLFGLFWHAAAVGSLWWVVRCLFPRHPQAAAWTAFLFAVYPGFNQQPLALMYGHFYIVLSAFFVSLGCMLATVRCLNNRMRVLITLIGLALSFVNLICMEYFFLLDVIRPLLLWFAATEGAPVDIRKRIRRVLMEWLPYLLLFLGMGIWRAFFFSYQTYNYPLQILPALKSNPLAALADLGLTILKSLWTVTGAAWGRVFSIPNPTEFGRVAFVVYAALVIFSAMLVLVVVLKNKSSVSTEKKSDWGLPMMVLGAGALLAAGWPFWLTGLPVGLSFPNDRFTLPFMLGASCFLAGLLHLISLPFKRFRGQALLLALLVGLAVGQHFVTANTFRMDWERQHVLFWHLRWRMPDLEPGTTLLAESWKGRYNSDNSLAAPLNWIYAPDNHTTEMDYMFYFPEVRLGRGLPEMKPDLPIYQNYLAATFEGNTSKMIALNYENGLCLRVLDPEIDPLNGMISIEMRQTAALSNPDLILPAAEGEDVGLDEALFGVEPAHGWCYYYEKADLARQLGDWEEVTALGEEAFAASDNPNDPNELLPFIEGYAHMGNWERAQEISREARRITPVMQPVLCALWQRIDEETSPSGEKDQALQTMRQELECSE